MSARATGRGSGRLSAGATKPDLHFDVLVVGSGFGGSVTALRLTEKGYRVGVLEAGRRFADEDFAKTSWRVRKFLWAPRLGLYGIQRIHLLPDAVILAGAGVGGGSLVYANTLYVPPAEFFADPAMVRNHRLVEPNSRPTTTRPAGCSASTTSRTVHRWTTLSRRWRTRWASARPSGSPRSGCFSVPAPAGPSPDPFFGGQGSGQDRLHRVR